MKVLSGKNVMVLEDEFLLAIEASETLEELGAMVLGPAYTIESALKLVEEQRPDAAVLDVNIGGTSSATVAERLSNLGVPIVFATGYGAHADVAVGSMIIDKPYTREQMERALLSVMR
jgi:CheY-like chemotaxis protein